MSPESQALRDPIAENAEAHAKYEADVAARLDGDTNRQATAAERLSTNDEVSNAAPRPAKKTAAKKTAAKKK